MLSFAISASDRKAFTTSLFALLLLTFLFYTSSIYSQSNTFKLGFTGAYPSDFLYPSNSQQNWSWYTDMKMNVWQGWWI